MSKTDLVKFTVIVPHYRDIEGLKLLMPSIPDRPDIQVIIVDDNSYDDASIVTKAIEDYKKSNVELVFNDPNHRGAGVCRNLALERACGRWLIYSDADDYFTEGAFDVFDSLYDRSEDIIFFPMTGIELPSGKKAVRQIIYQLKVEKYIKKPSHMAEVDLRYDFMVPWSKMVKKDFVVDNSIMYEDVMYSNDVIFCAKTGYCAKKIAADHRVVYCATRQSDRLASTKSKEAFITRFLVHMRKYEYLKGKISSKELRYVTLWPGTHLIRAIKDGYGLETFKYVLNTYKEKKISVFSFSLLRMIDVVHRKIVILKVKITR